MKKSVQVTFKNSVPFAKKTLLNYKDQISALFKEIITVYANNHIKAINTFCNQNTDS
jgi:hypothetical protein